MHSCDLYILLSDMGLIYIYMSQNLEKNSVNPKIAGISGCSSLQTPWMKTHDGGINNHGSINHIFFHQVWMVSLLIHIEINCFQG
jgi:hypothetical protein